MTEATIYQELILSSIHQGPLLLRATSTVQGRAQLTSPAFLHEGSLMRRKIGWVGEARGRAGKKTGGWLVSSPPSLSHPSRGREWTRRGIRSADVAMIELDASEVARSTHTERVPRAQLNERSPYKFCIDLQPRG